MSGRRVSSSVAVRFTQPLEPVSHRRRRRRRAGAASAPAAAAAWNSAGSSAAGRPIDATAQAVAREQLERVGRVDVDELVAAVDAGGVEVGAQARGLLGVGELGHRDQHPLAGRRARSAVALWCDSP